MKKKVKIILLKDVEGVGRKFEVADVATGYFRNSLLPNNLAELATDKALARLEKRREETEKEMQKTIAENKKVADKIKGKSFVFPVKAGEKDRVYGSVTKEDIADKLAKEGCKNVSVLLDQPIKEIGEKEVTVDFGEGVKVPIKVVLEKEE